MEGRLVLIVVQLGSARCVCIFVYHPLLFSEDGWLRFTVVVDCREWRCVFNGLMPRSLTFKLRSQQIKGKRSQLELD